MMSIVGSKSQLKFGGSSQFSKNSIFKIEATDLKQMFEDGVNKDRRLQMLQELGGVEAVLAKLQTEPNTGIMGDTEDLHRRQTKFNENREPQPNFPPFKESLVDALNDRILLVVGIFAVLSIIPGMIVDPAKGWIEGVAILVVLFLQVLITACNDSVKDKQFVALQSRAQTEDVPVLRGGSMQTVSIWSLVVGDVVSLTAGDKVPADCLVVKSVNMHVEEKGGEPKAYKSVEADPFLTADSYIRSGACKAVVVAVGENSTRSVIGEKLDTRDDDSELTAKLANIGKSLQFIAIISCLVVLVVSLIVTFIQVGVNEDVKGKELTKKMIDAITISIILLIVAVPEGLPMTLAISLAYSVLIMADKDKVLVRKLDSVEQVGLVTELVLGKTGTMTSEDMQVVKFYVQGQTRLNSRKDSLTNVHLTEEVVALIKDSILYNSTAYIEMSENSFYVPVGQGTEVALIKWLQAAETPVHLTLSPRNRAETVLAQVPFNSTLKKSVTAINDPNQQDTVRIFVKGAPEHVLESCDTTMDKDGMKVPMDDEERARIEEELRKYTKDGLRPIAISYRNTSVDDFNAFQDEAGEEIDSPEEIKSLIGEQTFVGIIALKDPVRPCMNQVVEKANKAGINIRLCSGDDLQTAKAVACDVGIISKADFDATPDAMDAQVAIAADEFRSAVGPIVRDRDEDGNATFAVRDQQAFDNLMRSVKVIGRATPEDKLLLVAGLRKMARFAGTDAETAGSRVAVVGEGINDVEAFDAANVSFAMQSGTSVARNNASMVLTSNEFESCFSAIMWGRNVYVNVQRFLQFQITCNIAVLLTVLIGYCTEVESPLSATQLIYINLIMDILGAIALASTRPNDDTATTKIGMERIMQPQIYRQIIGVSMYMLGMMMITMYAGRNFFEVDYTRGDMAINTPDKRKHFTLIWNTFVFLQVFNLVNCREVSATRMNGFSGIWTNWYTLLVVLTIIAVQLVSVYTFIGGFLFETYQPADNKITTQQFFVCVAIGASVLLGNALMKLIPVRFFAKVQMQEDKALGSGTKLMAVYDQQAHAKAFNKKNVNQSVDDSAEQPLNDSYQQVKDSL